MLKGVHRRYNLLADRWVLVSPHRTQRPWQGQEEELPVENLPKHDPECYLCPGNKRANNKINPDYKNTLVFTNDFPALLPENTTYRDATSCVSELLNSEPVSGICRVICFSPRHDLTLANMEQKDIVKVIDVWAEQFVELGADYQWVQVFENRGEIMGCSNPHPHCQIWASNSLPDEIIKEDNSQKKYYRQHGQTLLADYLKLELKQQERIVIENEHWVVIVPFWAVWPFETMLLPKRQVQYFADLGKDERKALAAIMQNLLIKYNNLFDVSFPYSMGWHGAPYQQKDVKHWYLHAHYHPPLLRSATIKKFMVGYEMLAEAQRDLTPELAAQRLREC